MHACTQRPLFAQQASGHTHPPHLSSSTHLPAHKAGQLLLPPCCTGPSTARRAGAVALPWWLEGLLAAMG
jgi:hypothetical protein